MKSAHYLRARNGHQLLGKQTPVDKSWIKTKADVDTKVAKNNMLNLHELFAVKFYHCHVMQLIAKKMGIAQTVVGIATTFYRRLYYKRTFSEFHPSLYSVCCLYLASKLEETALHQGQAEAVVLAAQHTDPHFSFKVVDLMKAEYFLLEELEFDLIVFTPYQPLPEYAKDAGMDSCLDTIWGIINDTYKLTDLCLLHPPYRICLAAIYMAAINEEKDVQVWFAELTIDIRVIADIANTINNSFSKFKFIKKADVTSALRKLEQCLTDSANTNTKQ